MFGWEILPQAQCGTGTMITIEIPGAFYHGLADARDGQDHSTLPPTNEYSDCPDRWPRMTHRLVGNNPGSGQHALVSISCDRIQTVRAKKNAPRQWRPNRVATGPKRCGQPEQVSNYGYVGLFPRLFRYGMGVPFLFRHKLLNLLKYRLKFVSQLAYKRNVQTIDFGHFSNIYEINYYLNPYKNNKSIVSFNSNSY